jgi:hypothetical protein
MLANHKKEWVPKSQIRKMPHLRKVHKYNKLLKSANLQICTLRKLFASHPPLLVTQLVFIGFPINFGFLSEEIPSP